MARVADTLREVGADAVVVGLPLLLSGTRGEAALAVERFARLLHEATGLEISLYDERFTSALAQRRMNEVGSKTRGQKGKLDQGAAVALLEDWLAKLSNERREDDRE